MQSAAASSLAAAPLLHGAMPRAACWWTRLNSKVLRCGTFLLLNSLSISLIVTAPHSPAAAFDFFDSKSKGRITTQDLKSRLTVFYKSLQPREFKFLMNNQPEMTFEQLYAMLADNELTNFDPVAEAFKIYDPTDVGYVNMDVLVDIFSHLGFGKLSEDDIKVRLVTRESASIYSVLDFDRASRLLFICFVTVFLRAGDRFSSTRAMPIATVASRWRISDECWTLARSQRRPPSRQTACLQSITHRGAAVLLCCCTYIIFHFCGSATAHGKMKSGQSAACRQRQ